MPKRGFTLVELLVAISILAIVAVLGWRGLDGIVRARIALTAQLEQTRGMQLAFAQLQSDCAHIVNEGSLPDRQRLYEGVAGVSRLTLVRTVFADDQPSRLQVVSYHLKDGVLTRRETTSTRDLDILDSLAATATNDADTSQEVVLQTGVSAMTVRAYVKGSGWMTLEKANSVQTSGPSTSAAPNGLEVSLQLQGQDVSLTKVFLLGPV